MFEGFPLDENPFVLQVGAFSWDKAPISSSWYHYLRFDNGKPHSVAITLLSEIINRLQPIVTPQGWRKRFAGDVLSVDYEALERKWCYSARQFRDAAAFLRKKGLIESIITKEVNENGHRRFKSYVVPRLKMIEAITKKEQIECEYGTVTLVRDASTCVRKGEIFLPDSEARPTDPEARSGVSRNEHENNIINKNINNTAHAHEGQDVVVEENQIREELLGQYSEQLLHACYENEQAHSWSVVRNKIELFAKALSRLQEVGEGVVRDAKQLCQDLHKQWPEMVRHQVQWVNVVLECDGLLRDQETRQNYLAWWNGVSPSLPAIRSRLADYAMRVKHESLWERMKALGIEEKTICDLLAIDAAKCEELVAYAEQGMAKRPAGFVVSGVRGGWVVGKPVVADFLYVGAAQPVEMGCDEATYYAYVKQRIGEIQAEYPNEWNAFIAWANRSSANEYCEFEWLDDACAFFRISFEKPLILAREELVS